MDEIGPRAEILRRIESKGPITFAEFMDIALYWGEGGYYTSSVGPWGGGGDYITSIDVSPVFARVMALAVIEMWEALGSPRSFVLIEAGAGRGYLSLGILDALERLSPCLYDALKVELVEVNPNLREGPSEKVSWRDELPSAGSVEYGVIISNELIDSFPFHRVGYADGSLNEIYVDCEGDRLLDVEGPLSESGIKVYFEDAGLELYPGQRAEVNLLAGPWVERAAAILKNGFVVTIDYGLPARELYGIDRIGGTLMCHYRHKANFEPYLRIGSQDITSHVDFTNLCGRGLKVGLKLAGFTTQKNFLLGLGVLEELIETEAAGMADYDNIKHNRAIAGLIAPGGMGDTFKVLVQYKGLDEAPSLKGFSFRDMSRYL